MSAAPRKRSSSPKNDQIPIDPAALVGRMVLGRYRVVQPLARGGMGMVYLGRIEGAAGFSKPVVIKRVLPHLSGEQDSQKQFVREARILSNLQHAGLVGILDFGEEHGAHVMVLEYVHGYHLGHWIKFVTSEGRLVQWQHAVLVLLMCLTALEYAHTLTRSDGTPLNIVHRDISPANILVDRDANVRLADFGIARSTNETGDFATTDGNIVRGKLPYIAPELFRSHPVSVASDVYSCGVVLYELLRGRNPFSAGDFSDTLNKVLNHHPEPISEIRDDVPAALDQVLQKSIAKEPADRYQTADEFAAALRGVLDRDERVVFADFRETIRADFTGALPHVRDLTPLDELEEVWRNSHPDPNTAHSLRVASQPPSGRLSSRPPIHTADTVIDRPSFADDRPRTSNKNMVLITMGAGVVGVAAVVGTLLLTRPSEPAEPPPSRYLVVERPTESKTGAEVTPTPAPEAPATTSAAPAPVPDPAPPSDSTTAKTPTARPATARPATNSGGDVSSLTRAFARRQGAVQGCFAANAGALEGSPQISVRFRVGTSGNVESASLIPSSLSSTALGSCLLQVARGTDFGPQENAVTFSIPITARVVKK